MTDFRWDNRTQRYRSVLSNGSLGSFVSKRDVDRIVEDRILQSATEMNDLTTRLINGSIGIRDWENAIAARLKTITIQQYSLGIGGVGRLTQRDYGRIGAMLKFQYRKLRSFSNDIMKGRLTENQIRSRLTMYFDKTFGAYERGRLEGHKNNGFLFERRFLHSIQPCQECNTYASLGWRAIGTLPDPTENCSCKAKCKCSKSFSKTDPSKESATIKLIDTLKNNFYGFPITRN